MKPCENPFRSSCVDGVRYTSLSLTTKRLYERFCILDYKAAIVGDHGRGKSTLLRAVGQLLNDDSVPTTLVFINDTVPFPRNRQKSLVKNLNAETVVLIDGIDLLSKLRRRRFLRYLSKRCKGVLAVSHSRPGLPILTECISSSELLKRIVKTLLDDHGLSMIENAMIENVFQRHKGNIRDCLSELYDIYADNYV